LRSAVRSARRWSVASPSVPAASGGRRHACLVDAAAAAQLIAIVEDLDRYDDTSVAANETGDLDRGIELTDPVSGASAFAFTSGWGDGAYPV
jgi:hypothetical protein